MLVRRKPTVLVQLTRLLSRLIDKIPTVKSKVEFDDVGVTRTMPDGRQEFVSWDELQEVFIVTTDEGPFVDDVFWMLRGSNGRCAVPSQTPGAHELVERLQQLSGFNHDAAIKAMSSAENAKFVCWTRNHPGADEKRGGESHDHANERV